MNIPEESIAIAARIISEVDYPNYEDDPKFAKRVLEASAPYIIADALRSEANSLAQLANIHAATNTWIIVDRLRAEARRIEKGDS